MPQPERLQGQVKPARRVAFLVLGGAVMLCGAWAVAPIAGPPVAVMAGLFGWLACWIARLPPPPPRNVGSAIAEPPVPTATTQDLLREAASTLRHDLRGILSPALLISDRLLTHEDPVVRKAGDVISRTVERAAERLEQG